MKKKTDDQLKADVEKGLRELLGGKSTKTPEEREELRANLKLAMQFRAIESKIGDDEYGTGFSNGEQQHKIGSDDDD